MVGETAPAARGSRSWSSRPTAPHGPWEEVRRGVPRCKCSMRAQPLRQEVSISRPDGRSLHTQAWARECRSSNHLIRHTTLPTTTPGCGSGWGRGLPKCLLHRASTVGPGQPTRSSDRGGSAGPGGCGNPQSTPAGRRTGQAGQAGQRAMLSWAGSHTSRRTCCGDAPGRRHACCREGGKAPPTPSFLAPQREPIALSTERRGRDSDAQSLCLTPGLLRSWGSHLPRWPTASEMWVGQDLLR